jgi:sporulation protein YlmC with PRC-barrel domain
MALQDGAILSVLIDGTFQGKITNVTINTTSGQIVQETISEGLSGFSPGSGQTTISGTSIVGIGGLEFDWHSASAKGGYHSIQVVIGAKMYTGTGKFMDASTSQSVNAGTESSFNWTGVLKALE